MRVKKANDSLYLCKKVLCHRLIGFQGLPHFENHGCSSTWAQHLKAPNALRGVAERMPVMTELVQVQYLSRGQQGANMDKRLLSLAASTLPDVPLPPRTL